MADKTYPIGTKIKYIGYCRKCDGKIGKVIKGYAHTCKITLPQSTCTSAVNMGGKIICSWSDVELAVRKNEQLLFSFME